MYWQDNPYIAIKCLGRFLRLITLNLRILAMMHYMLYIPDFGRGPVRGSFSKMTPNNLWLQGQMSF